MKISNNNKISLLSLSGVEDFYTLVSSSLQPGDTFDDIIEDLLFQNQTNLLLLAEYLSSEVFTTGPQTILRYINRNNSNLTQIHWSKN